MKKLVWGSLAVLFLLCAHVPAASASGTGSVGCGPGSTSALTACTGNVVNSGGVYSTSSSIDVTLTAFTCASSCGFLTNGLIGEELTVNNDTWQFNFSATNGGTGTFSFSDSDGVGGAPDFLLSGTVTMFAVAPGNIPNTTLLILNINPTLVGFGFDAGSGGPPRLFTSAVSGYTGSISILDPGGNVLGLTGAVNYTSIPTPSQTPEPGTLLLLGSGLTGIGFIRRKLVQA